MSPGGAPEEPDQHVLVERRNLPTVVTPHLRSFSEVTRPTPQSRSIGSGCRNLSSSCGGTRRRPLGFATPLATLARNFVLATPTVIGKPTCSSTSLRSFAAISTRRPGQPSEARGRRGTPRRSRAPPRAASCLRTPRTPPCSPPRTPTSGEARRRPAGTAVAPVGRPSRCGCRTPSPRSSQRERRRRRRSPACRGAADRHVARRTRRRRRGRRGGSAARAARTHVPIGWDRRQAASRVAAAPGDRRERAPRPPSRCRAPRRGSGSASLPRAAPRRASRRP